eukprot:8605136-Karenia_brevis.AAC.1
MEVKKAKIGELRGGNGAKRVQKFGALGTVADGWWIPGRSLGGSRNPGNLVWRVPVLSLDHALPHCASTAGG